jgi:hypothetical protein
VVEPAILTPAAVELHDVVRLKIRGDAIECGVEVGARRKEHAAGLPRHVHPFIRQRRRAGVRRRIGDVDRHVRQARRAPDRPQRRHAKP